jgi:hypothetical protein
MSNEIGGACDTYGRQERCVQGFGGGDQGRRSLGRHIGRDEMIILKWIFKKWEGGMDRD